MIAVAFSVGLLAFIGGAFAERQGYLHWQSASTAEPVAAGNSPILPHYYAILAAGDSSIPNFDNAVEAMARRLESAGAETMVLTSDRKLITDWRGLATAYQIDVLFNQMDLKADDGCLVFVTSHGNEYGLEMKADEEEYNYLTPTRLAGILTRHCGDRPTVAILSGCHTGTFLSPQMQRDNRIILTAARHDRTSFGCSTDTSFTYFDECLLESMGGAGTWETIFDRTKACIAEKEKAQGFESSLPQAYFGSAVKNLRIE